MSFTTAATSAPAANTPGSRSTVSPPIATSGMIPIRRFHSEIRSSPCGDQGITLSDVAPKRDELTVYLTVKLKWPGTKSIRGNCASLKGGCENRALAGYNLDVNPRDRYRKVGLFGMA